MTNPATMGYMPTMQCPNCQDAWQWDDYYEVEVGDERECPNCEATIVVTVAEQMLFCKLEVKPQDQTSEHSKGA